jgi:hypothetical protein
MSSMLGRRRSRLVSPLAEASLVPEAERLQTTGPKLAAEAGQVLAQRARCG